MMIIIIIFYICDIQYFLIFKAYEKLNFLSGFYSIPKIRNYHPIHD